MNNLLDYIKKDSTMCTGCRACEQICPTSYIKIVPDKEGFLYPQKDVSKKCIECGLCMKHCPMLVESFNDNVQEAYGFSCSNEERIFYSTSGGAFQEMARKFINQDSWVFGAAFDEEFNVITKGANSLDELPPLLHS